MKMRSAVIVAVVLSAGCGGEKKRDTSRFVVEVIDVTSGVTATVAGKPIELVSDGGSLRGAIDLKESEVPAKTTRPVIVLSTPCGPKPFEYKPAALDPPNEYNVVQLRLNRDALPHTTFVFAPSVKGPVTIGDIAVPTPIPRKFGVFDAGCGKPIQVGSESSPIEGGHRAIVVAASSQACLKRGVSLFGSGPNCQPEWSETLTGKLLHPLREVPGTLFEPVASEVEVTQSTPCTNVSWLQEC